jgi:hypothetical protein
VTQLLTPNPYAPTNEGDRVAWDDTGAKGWIADPRTGLGPHHVTRHEVDVSVPSRHQYWVSGWSDMTYNNVNCTKEFTITPK